MLEAMQQVPRHLFVEDALASRAYEDVALPIGHGQTISKPSTVAAMVEPSLAGVAAERHVQFERHGYFLTDRRDHGAAAPVFNRVTGLKDSWAR